jgi:hypothetical protein
MLFVYVYVLVSYTVCCRCIITAYVHIAKLQRPAMGSSAQIYHALPACCGPMYAMLHNGVVIVVAAALSASTGAGQVQVARGSPLQSQRSSSSGRANSQHRQYLPLALADRTAAAARLRRCSSYSNPLDNSTQPRHGRPHTETGSNPDTVPKSGWGPNPKFRQASNPDGAHPSPPISKKFLNYKEIQPSKSQARNSGRGPNLAGPFLNGP